MGHAMKRDPCQDVTIYTAPGCSRGVIVLVGDAVHGHVLTLTASDADNVAQALFAAAQELARSFQQQEIPQ
jgi:hypothetical protein